MQSTNLQFKINHLKDVLFNFSNEEKKMIGVTIIRENSSDNWLFNTDVDITSIVPTVLKALEKEIAQLEEVLKPILEAEAIQAAIDAEEKAKQDAIEAIESQKQAEIQAKFALMKANQELGLKMVETYLYDNSELNLTTQQTLTQLQKFGAIKQLLELGSMKAAKELIFMSEVDEIFTQERKDKYLLML